MRTFFCGTVASQSMGEEENLLTLRRGRNWMMLDIIIISSSCHNHQTLASSIHHNHPEEVTAYTPSFFIIQDY
jgi:hypothetical protein